MLKRTAWEATAVAGLFLGPGVLGFLAKSFPSIFERFLSTLYSARPELLTVLVSPLVLVIVVYAFLSRGRRMRIQQEGKRVPDGWRRRFLPPMELALLQIGNLTFGAFALILANLTLAFLFSLLRNLILQWPLLAQSFTASLTIVSLVMVFALHPRVLRAHSWRRLRGAWIKRASLVAVAVGALGMATTTESLGFLKLQLVESQLAPREIAALYAGFLTCLSASYLIARGRQARAAEKESFHPLTWFIPVFALAWTANLGLYALYLHAVFLTLHAYLRSV